MKLCHCGRPNCAGTTTDCHPLRVKAGETPRQALDREGAEKRAANPATGWRARRAGRN